MAYTISRANPANMKFLKYLYELVANSGSTLSFNEFLECRDSIYMCVDPMSGHHKYDWKRPNQIYSFLACKRINANELRNVLEFHCQPYNIVYSIDILYLHDISNTECLDMCRNLLQVNSVSKLDAFIVLRLTEEYKELLEKTITSQGYYLSDIVNDGIYTFIKSPIFQE